MVKKEPSEKKKGRISGHVTHRAAKKAKSQMYLTRSTCGACKAVFKSPKYRLAHVASGHQTFVGQNKNRQVKSSYEAVFIK